MEHKKLNELMSAGQTFKPQNVFLIPVRFPAV